MAGYARSEVVREGEIGVYHAWSRCVQRAFLCGNDPLTGRNFDYRRDWIERLLEYQAGVFAVDVGNYAILQNHEHLIARTRPDIAAGWSDEEVAWRWKLAWPEWRDGRWIREPTDQEIQELLANQERLKMGRNGLSSLSWFMARWKEPIARLANQEMNTKGHFWEQRFGCRELAGAGAVLTCFIYVDVNQVKAGEAPCLEQSRHTAIGERLRTWQAEQAQASVDKFHDMKGEGYNLTKEDVKQLLGKCWLSPITTKGPLLLPGVKRPDASATRAISEQTELEEDDDATDECGATAAADDSPTEDGPEDSTAARDAEPATPQAPGSRTRRKARSPSRKIHRRLKGKQRRRASDQAFLCMPFEQYVEMAQWAAAQTLAQQGRPASQDLPPPPDLASRLQGSHLNSDRWYSAIDHFQEWFHGWVGPESKLDKILANSSRRWRHGIRRCRDVFT